MSFSELIVGAAVVSLSASGLILAGAVGYAIVTSTRFHRERARAALAPEPLFYVADYNTPDEEAARVAYALVLTADRHAGTEWN